MLQQLSREHSAWKVTHDKTKADIDKRFKVLSEEEARAEATACENILTAILERDPALTLPENTRLLEQEREISITSQSKIRNTETRKELLVL